MSKKKKGGINLSSKIHFKKPIKSLSIPNYARLLFSSTTPRFAPYYIQALSSGSLTKRQIEAARVALRRPLKRFGDFKLWVRVKPSTILTKRSPGIRMGRGKGGPISQVALIHAGQILFEFTGPPFVFVSNFFEKAQAKLPVPTKLIGHIFAH